MSPGEKEGDTAKAEGCVLVSISRPMRQTPLDLSRNYCCLMTASWSWEGIS